MFGGVQSWTEMVAICIFYNPFDLIYDYVDKNDGDNAVKCVH